MVDTNNQEKRKYNITDNEDMNNNYWINGLIIIAEAQRQSQILRGEGEGERNRVLGDAFGKDAGFFDFYRSMEAYGEALGDGTTMVLSPDSEFFRFFGSSEGRPSK